MKVKTIGPALILVLLLTAQALFAVPDEISFMGRLLKSGTPVTTAVNMTFELFQFAAGGTNVWSDAQVVVPNGDGIYVVKLGSGASPIPVSYDSLWIQVTVGSNTLSPRRELTSVPYALNVGTLPDLDVGGDVTIDGDVTLAGGTPTHRITNVADPTDDSDVATKAYVDTGAGGGCGCIKVVKATGYGSATVDCGTGWAITRCGEGSGAQSMAGASYSFMGHAETAYAFICNWAAWGSESYTATHSGSDVAIIAECVQQ